MEKNIFTKLQEMRCELQGMNLKKSGENKFAKYKYYELGDILPTINKLMLKHKVSSVVNFGLEVANLELINCEIPTECLMFASPMSKAALKGCHEVQNLGAVQTYLRRYLYMAAFEIVEHDAVSNIKPEECISEKQLGELCDIIDNNKIDTEKFLLYMNADELQKIPASDFTKAINALKAKVKS